MVVVVVVVGVVAAAVVVVVVVVLVTVVVVVVVVVVMVVVAVVELPVTHSSGPLKHRVNKSKTSAHYSSDSILFNCQLAHTDSSQLEMLAVLF